MPFPSPGDLPEPGVEPGSPTLQAEPPEGSIGIDPSLPVYPHHSPVGSHMFVLYVCVSNSALKVDSPALPFLDSVYVCYYMRS